MMHTFKTRFMLRDTYKWNLLHITKVRILFLFILYIVYNLIEHFMKHIQLHQRKMPHISKLLLFQNSAFQATKDIISYINITCQLQLLKQSIYH